MSDGAKEREIEKADRQIERKTAWVNGWTNKMDRQTEYINSCLHFNLFELMDASYILSTSGHVNK